MTLVKVGQNAVRPGDEGVISRETLAKAVCNLRTELTGRKSDPESLSDDDAVKPVTRIEFRQSFYGLRRDLGLIPKDKVPESNDSDGDIMTVGQLRLTKDALRSEWAEHQRKELIKANEKPAKTDTDDDKESKSDSKSRASSRS